MEEVRSGLWTWTAPHSEWDEQPAVRSYAVERDGVLVLIDPMSPPTELVEGRELQVALNASWHSRSSARPDASLPAAQRAGRDRRMDCHRGDVGRAENDGRK